VTASSSRVRQPSPEDEERPTKRQRQVPPHFRDFGFSMHNKKLRDIFPEAVPALPPVGMDVPSRSPAATGTTEEAQMAGSSGSQARGSHPVPVLGRVRKTLNTMRNIFGLFRRYHAEQFPTHDPEGDISMAMLSNVPEPDHCASSFSPYPNQTSFRLGDWYWNGGIQKSQESFQQLLKIVGDESFDPGDIRATNWDKINQQLACNETDEAEWLDKYAGWRTDSVKIPIPFHRLTDNPGCKDYIVTDFHHRPLVSVIREKLQNPCNSHLFHYEPYELFWQPTDEHEEIRVDCKLYSSPAFITAHNDLQNLPGEPECDLPRVVVALMFWSDSTQLTNFGDAQLWPLYMFFGNESKYCRCRPSCNLCEHIAYFEKVSNRAIFVNCLAYMS
jgi:hypothetical protein